MRDEQPHRPTDDNRAAWRAYWAALGLPWRTEPEIDAARQAYLAERRAVTPDIEKGIYPFRDENGSIKLDRADVEWLLATHESGGLPGPVWWDEEKHKAEKDRRDGLDLRGADLGALDLTRLPLARTLGGQDIGLWYAATSLQLEAAAVHMEHAFLDKVHLEGAAFLFAHLEDADLREACLQQAVLVNVQLQHAWLYRTHLQGAVLWEAQLQRAFLVEARLDSSEATGRADLRKAFFDAATTVEHTNLGEARLAGLHWGGADLALADWWKASRLGDEYEAWKRVASDGTTKDRPTVTADFEAAIQANRQLAAVLRTQGLNEDADRFAYRAQVLQRKRLQRQRRLGGSLGSWLLDAISGYGYKPIRSVIAYVLIICLFAGAYLLNAQFAAPHLSWDEALVLSISSFHGRGFFSSGISLGDTLARLAAGEAIIGLLIEITFIATFTQRFFAR